MNPPRRHRIAALGAASAIAAFGVFASMGSASAATGPNDQQGSFQVDSISGAVFESDTVALPDGSCAEADSATGPVTYCEHYSSNTFTGTTWDAYIAIPQGATLDASVMLTNTGSTAGDAVQVGGPVHSDSEYVHLTAQVSPLVESAVQDNLALTLSNGSSYEVRSTFQIGGIRYAGMVEMGEE